MGYGTFETLRRQNAVLKGTVELNSGIQLAAWYNNCDTVTVRSDHHTLSLYVADGYESYQKTPHGWKNGGGPDRFCLMPKGDVYKRQGYSSRSVGPPRCAAKTRPAAMCRAT